MRHKSKGTLRHKDAFVSLQNVDLKGRKKLLAKARVNLSDYYVAASVSPVAFKLKLFPESSKISSAFVHFSVHRTDADPASLSFPVNPDDHEVEVSPVLNAGRRRTSQVSSHYDEDSDADEFDEKRFVELSPKTASPIPGNRPSSLLLKNAITVEKPEEPKVDNNNDKFKTSFTTTASFPPKPTYLSTLTTTVARETSQIVKFDSVAISSFTTSRQEVQAEPAASDKRLGPERSRLLAEPEDFHIDTPKKVVSGIVLPTGPPPPLPERTLSRSPLPSLRNDKPQVDPDVNGHRPNKVKRCRFDMLGSSPSMFYF
jgi:hypothetical protein